MTRAALLSCAAGVLLTSAACAAPCGWWQVAAVFLAGAAYALAVVYAFNGGGSKR